ncbi:carbohydrate-binding module family 12 protein [Botryobasidium botryosum FD-172 SS1]|uniref:Carbohydrate-binding module family 12 protein n=1 Tax=Botryobasidium botryosum (strain FD-172 SS1) TaxID=930990 RepID=A0A067N362_BOTB1|nr:carbohydrate-binding module family 12 protein [Botryobasidium botryosum FD-172 SS1]
MAEPWQPGTWYDPGSEVEYEGVNYRIIQPHQSQDDWAPPNVPALWGRMQYQGNPDFQPEEYQGDTQSAPQIQRPTWVGVYGTDIPDNAIEGGRDSDGSILYIARAVHEGGIHPGKAGRHLRIGAVIGYGGGEIEVDQYEVLVGDQNSVRWNNESGEINFQALSGELVEGGREANGDILYIAQASYENALHPGKTNAGFGGAVVSYAGEEHIVHNYGVLVYA